MARAAAAAEQGGQPHGGGDDGQPGEGLGYDASLGDDDDGLTDAFEDAIEASESDEEEFEAPQRRSKKDARARDDDAADEDEDDDGEEGDDDRGADDEDEDDEDTGDDQDDEDDGEEGDDDREAAGDDVIKVEGQDYRVSDLLDSHKAFNEVKGQVNEIVSRYEAKGAEYAKAAEAKVTEMDGLLKLVSELVPNLEAIDPPTTMLDARHDDYDPDAYHFLKAQREQIIATLDKAKAAIKEKDDRQKAEAKDRTDKYVQREAQALAKVMPQFADPAKAAAAEKALRDDLKKHFKMDDELMNRLVDHRLFVIADAAIKYAKAQAKGAPKPKGKNPPKHVRTRRGKGGSKRQGDASRKAALDRLARTGRVADADLEATWGDVI